MWSWSNFISLDPGGGAVAVAPPSPLVGSPPASGISCPVWQSLVPKGDTLVAVPMPQGSPSIDVLHRLLQAAEVAGVREWVPCLCFRVKTDDRHQKAETGTHSHTPAARKAGAPAGRRAGGAPAVVPPPVQRVVEADGALRPVRADGLQVPLQLPRLLQRQPHLLRPPQGPQRMDDGGGGVHRVANSRPPRSPGSSICRYPTTNRAEPRSPSLATPFPRR